MLVRRSRSLHQVCKQRFNFGVGKRQDLFVGGWSRFLPALAAAKTSALHSLQKLLFATWNKLFNAPRVRNDQYDTFWQRLTAHRGTKRIY
jgi:hypothetical protein